MRSLSPEERARRERVVRRVRAFFAAYAGLLVLLLLPGLSRAAGLPLLDPLASAWVARLTLLALLVAVPAFWAWLVSAGEYRFGAGLRFQLAPALFEGEYLVDPDAARRAGTPEHVSPLGPLVRDVAEVQARLLPGGHLALAEAHAAALREAEALARLVERVDAAAAPEPLAEARAALSAWQDHLELLRAGLLGAGAPPAEALPVAEADLASLRRCSDALRRGLVSPGA